MIAIHLNGEALQVPEDLTLATLLEWLKLAADQVAIEHNLEIAPRDRWAAIPLKSGDRLEVVHFVGGGSVTCKSRLRIERPEAFWGTPFD